MKAPCQMLTNVLNLPLIDSFQNKSNAWKKKTRSNCFLETFFRHTWQLNVIPFQLLITFLKVLIFSDDFIWRGSEFQILGSKMLLQKVTCFIFGVSRLSLYWLQIALFDCLKLKIHKTRIYNATCFVDFNT